MGRRFHATPLVTGIGSSMEMGRGPVTVSVAEASVAECRGCVHVSSLVAVSGIQWGGVHGSNQFSSSPRA